MGKNTIERVPRISAEEWRARIRKEQETELRRQREADEEAKTTFIDAFMKGLDQSDPWLDKGKREERMGFGAHSLGACELIKEELSALGFSVSLVKPDTADDRYFVYIHDPFSTEPT